MTRSLAYDRSMDYAFHRLARSAPNYRWWRPIVTGLIAVGFFLAFTIVLTVVFRAMKVDEGVDQTKADDYWADLGDEDVEPELDPYVEPHR